MAQPTPGTAAASSADRFEEFVSNISSSSVRKPKRLKRVDDVELLKSMEDSELLAASPHDCLKLEKLDRKLSNVSNLSLADEEFIYNVGIDIDHFLKQRHNASVLLFPPVNNFRRFLIHQTCENFRQKYDLFTFSVGQGPFRRTVVCFKNQLLDPSKFTDSAATATFESRKKTPVQNWRSERRVEPTHENLTTTSSIAKREKNLLTGKMGVEKILGDTRSTKTSSADLYRPPALRNYSVEMLDTKHCAGASNAAVTLDAPPTSSSPSSSSAPRVAATVTATTSISCNSSPIHGNENSKFDKSLTSTCAATAMAAETGATTASIQQRQQQQAARRERRPDRAVYIPRARRSQTTPPTATTTTAPAVTTIATPSAVSATVSCDSASSSKQQQQQLPITPDSKEPVCTVPSFKTDELVGKSLSKKCKSLSSRERKERAKKSGSDAQAAKISKLSGKPLIEDTTSIEVKASQNVENKSKITTLNCDNVHSEQKEQNEEISTSSAIIISSIASDTDTAKSPIEHPKLDTVETGQLSAEITTANEMNVANIGRDRHAEIANLRIEDVASKENARSTAKCDIEEQEFQRASKEINRSNRRIIKQTFVSDVLEIPEKINTTIDDECVTTGATLATIVPSSLTIGNNSGVDSTTEEEEEDDWETMFDDTGECLDPKIMQELTASVGKVKIEQPKMDYSAYLTKQSLLNEEEFPHVLEVSNFPVEFKNQDLLMVFSQYKESGFDIKWVDDTHALAVFSSSRIAAEVLTMGHPFVVLKPLAEATIESRVKAKKCAGSLQPYRQRPETCAALARRLVTGALGVRLKTAAAERENEKRVLREAKERKLLAAKQRDEAWES